MKKIIIVKFLTMIIHFLIIIALKQPFIQTSIENLQIKNVVLKITRILRLMLLIYKLFKSMRIIYSNTNQFLAS